MPMLDKAIEARNKQFVAHDFTQQVLRDLMVTMDNKGRFRKMA